MARGPSRDIRSPVRVFLLGATGSVGRRTAAELLRQPEVEELVVAGRNRPVAEGLATALGGGSDRVRAQGVTLEADDLALQLTGCDVVVSCAGPFYETEVAAARAAIDAGVSYVSLCDEALPYEEVQSLEESIVSSGITIVSGCGLSPGITNMLIAHAASELDEVESVDIALGRSSSESTGPAAARHFLFELASDAFVIEDRQRRSKKAGTGPKLVYFPEPVGWVETFRVGHPEVLSLPGVYPSLESLEFRIGLAERITMDTARAFAATPLVDSERARRAFVSTTRPLRPFIDRLPPTGPPWTAARVDVRGSAQGSHATISLGVADRLVNFASIPLTLAALRLGSGDHRGPGLKTPEEAFGVGSFLHDLSRRGIGIARLEPTPV